MTHHVRVSLIPAETGATYVQQVTVEGDELTMTTRERRAGAEMTRRKIWRRIRAAENPM